MFRISDYPCWVSISTYSWTSVMERMTFIRDFSDGTLRYNTWRLSRSLKGRQTRWRRKHNCYVPSSCSFGWMILKRFCTTYSIQIVTSLVNMIWKKVKITFWFDRCDTLGDIHGWKERTRKERTTNVNVWQNLDRLFNMYNIFHLLYARATKD